MSSDPTKLSDMLFQEARLTRCFLTMVMLRKNPKFFILITEGECRVSSVELCLTGIKCFLRMEKSIPISLTYIFNLRTKSIF